VGATGRRTTQPRPFILPALTMAVRPVVSAFVHRDLPLSGHKMYAGA